MSNGFFSASKLTQVKAPISLIPKCGACGLFKKCKTPKLEPYGRGNKKVLIIAEQVSETEDDIGAQLVGESGKFLIDTIKELGFNIERDFIRTYSLICATGKDSNGKTVKAKDDAITYCTPNLLKIINDFNPEVIIPMGFKACKAVIGHFWKSDVGPIERWAGFQIPSQKPNAWICPTYAPNIVLGNEHKLPTMKLFFKRHLKKALEKIGTRPWEGVIPDYRKGINILYDENKIDNMINKIISKGKIASFDYEANMLKPDSTEARIYTASICVDGKYTMSFPITGKTSKSMVKFLRSPIKKIAHNMKFEERWSKAVLKTRVRNWYFDSLLGSHALNNIPGTKSLKFQSYVLLGCPNYDGHIDFKDPSNKGDEGANSINNIRNIDMEDLLLYGGIDSYLTYKIAQLQTQKFKGK